MVGDLLSFLGISALLGMLAKDQNFPKSLLIIGIVAGILAAVGSLAFIPAYKHMSFLSLMFIGGFATFAVWEVAAGLFLLRSNTD